MDASSVSKTPSVVQSLLQDLVANARAQGIDIPQLPSGPIPFSGLLHDLLALDFIRYFSFPIMFYVPFSLFIGFDGLIPQF